MYKCDGCGKKSSFLIKGRQENGLYKRYCDACKPKKVTKVITKDRLEYLHAIRSMLGEKIYKDRIRGQTPTITEIAEGKKIRCVKCGKEKAFFERHHLDYDRPDNVVILCVKCHKAEHTRLNRLPRQQKEA